jgi:para-nitrobenzyl esterase
VRSKKTVTAGSHRALGIALLAGLTLLALAPRAASAAGVVSTDKGPVRGTETPALKEYLGIPYAAPPVGELRWRPPQPHARWHGPLDATHFGNHCPQTASFAGVASTSEDCLYLNVYVPNESPNRDHAKRLPVMVWIHGGGFTAGESDDYDPTRLVRQGVVVVTLNYRLGALGFLAHPALSAESGEHSSSNYGLMDQQAALRWVRRNIAHFGGNPKNVTIFGESAGGLSVYAQLASPLAAGLFQRAIAQSGSYAMPLEPLSQAEASGVALAKRLGCTDEKTAAACMRAAPVSKILENQRSDNGFSIVPPVDGHVLPRSLDTAFQSGEFNRVPVIEGTTHDEFTLFYKLAVEDIFGVIPPSAYSFILNVFVSALPTNATAAEVAFQYTLHAYGESVGQAVSALATDDVFSCPARRATQAMSRFVPTFEYELKDPNVPQVFLPPASYPYGAYHSSDLLFLFDSPTHGHAPLSADEERLAEAMIGYWTQFSRAGDPNSASTPTWSPYEVGTEASQSLHPPTPVSETGFAGDHKCGFWDAHG